MMMMMMVLAYLLLAYPALAVEPDEMLDNPILEERARLLTRNLRCLVCEGEVIDESNAPFARNVRTAVRQKIMDGSSDHDIITWLRSVYGERIFLHSPPSFHHLLLWLAPFLFIGGGFWWLTRGRRN